MGYIPLKTSIPRGYHVVAAVIFLVLGVAILSLPLLVLLVRG